MHRLQVYFLLVSCFDPDEEAFKEFIRHYVSRMQEMKQAPLSGSVDLEEEVHSLFTQSLKCHLVSFFVVFMQETNVSEEFCF